VFCGLMNRRSSGLSQAHSTSEGSLFIRSGFRDENCPDRMGRTMNKHTRMLAILRFERFPAFSAVTGWNDIALASGALREQLAQLQDGGK